MWNIFELFTMKNRFFGNWNVQDNFSPHRASSSCLNFEWTCIIKISTHFLGRSGFSKSLSLGRHTAVSHSLSQTFILPCHKCEYILSFARRGRTKFRFAVATNANNLSDIAKDIRFLLSKTLANKTWQPVAIRNVRNPCLKSVHEI